MSLRRRGRTISDRLPATPFRLPTVFRVNAVRAVPAGSFPALYGYFADSGRMISIVRPESLFPGVGNPVAWGKCLDYEEGVSSTCVIVRSIAVERKALCHRWGSLPSVGMRNQALDIYYSVP